MSAHRERWSAFFKVVLDPWNLLLKLAVGGIFYVSLQKAEPLTSALLSVLLTLTAAVLGGRITQQWSAVTEAGVLIARGRSAVRSLKLLLRNVAALESRIRSFLAKEEELQRYPEVTKRNYEEAIAICSLLQEETVSSIENWTGIVPEADIKTQVGVISDLKRSIDEKESELTQLQTTLNEAKGKSDQERSHLRDLIKEKEKQILDLEREIVEKKVRLGAVGFGSIVTSPMASAQFFGNKISSGMLDLGSRNKFSNSSIGSVLDRQSK